MYWRLTACDVLRRSFSISLNPSLCCLSWAAFCMKGATLLLCRLHCQETAVASISIIISGKPSRATPNRQPVWRQPPSARRVIRASWFSKNLSTSVVYTFSRTKWYERRGQVNQSVDHHFGLSLGSGILPSRLPCV